MEIRALGDKAILIELGSGDVAIDLARVLAVANRFRVLQRPGIEEIVPGLNAVAIHLRTTASWRTEARWVERVLAEALPEASVVADTTGLRVIEIPVIYGQAYGLDLAEVAAQTGLSPEAVVERHAAGTYHVQAIGFAPGFPYLGGLESALRCPRRKTPRTGVPAGSVGIGGSQTGVYPMAMPGGWNLIGRTPLRLFDAAREAGSPSLLQAGDQVRFRAIDEAEFDRISRDQATAGTRAPFAPAGGAEVEVLSPGMQTTVQDAQRSGFQRWGVSTGGSMNARAARLANTLVGNTPDSAVLEWAVKGPILFFNDARVLAVAGATVAGVPFARSFEIESGEVLDLSMITAGFRGVLAISGGVDVPLVLGSRSTHLAAGFGGFKGRALKKRDRLALHDTDRRNVERGWFPAPHMLAPPDAEPGKVRFVRGPEWEWFDEGTREKFATTRFHVMAQSNRMGIRLGGGALSGPNDKPMISQPVTGGTVQVPPDGSPIVLMADRQSLGGYPRLANVIWTDLSILAELGPKEKFQFKEVSLDEAEAWRLRAEGDFGLMEAGAKRHFGVW
jgi:antagonist of KipI